MTNLLAAIELTDALTALVVLMALALVVFIVRSIR